MCNCISCAKKKVINFQIILNLLSQPEQSLLAAKTALAKNLTALFCELKKHRNISSSRLQTLPPALSRQKDDKRIPARLLNTGNSRRQLHPKRNDIARDETFQEASLFGLVKTELKGWHMDSQNHPKCSVVSEISPWDGRWDTRLRGNWYPL